MELSQLAKRLQVPTRTLRYLIEQKVDPELAMEGLGHGKRRVLSKSQLLVAGLASMLYQLGFRGELLATLLGSSKPELFAQRKPKTVRLQLQQKGVTVNMTVDLSGLRELLK